MVDGRARKAFATAAVLVVCIALPAAGCDAARPPAPLHSVRVDKPAGAELGVLQVNLCDSGLATCFTGRSVARTAALIREQRPDLVTVNEACREDVSVLTRAMSEAFPDRTVTRAFEAAVDRLSDNPYRCRNGEQYGIGIVAAVAHSGTGRHTYSGVYPIQDPADPEERVWLCLETGAALLACTSHTASTKPSVALAQCRYFFGSALPRIAGRHAEPVVFAADLNLLVGHSPGPQSCVPPGYRLAGDGARMDVIAGPGIAIRSRAILDMNGTTDHPGLLVELTLPDRTAR
jgi:hypothetical protein